MALTSPHPKLFRENRLLSPDILPYKKEYYRGKVKISAHFDNRDNALNYTLPKIVEHVDAKGVTEILRIVTYDTREIMFEALICIPQLT